MSRRTTKDWLDRELTILAVVHEIVRSIEQEAENYDSVDFIIDLLLCSSVIPAVSEYLDDEYTTAFRENLNGLEDYPDESARYDAVNAKIDGKSFSDRIKEYASEGLDGFETKMATLIKTDGHRVRSEGALSAGDSLTSAGLTVTKTWHGVMDEKERDAHVRLENVTVPYDGMFEIDGFKAPAPGLFGIAELDVNCRCELEIRISDI